MPSAKRSGDFVLFNRGNQLVDGFEVGKVEIKCRRGQFLNPTRPLGQGNRHAVVEHPEYG